MKVGRSQEVKTTLQEMKVHDSWTSGYRTPENEPFYALSFDYLATIYGPSGDEPVLDAGCGSSTKSIHLARRGYSVLALDISEPILDLARKVVTERGLQDRVNSRICADLTVMPFSDDSFGRVLCWGVLMHVPDVEEAVAELARVTRKGGTIVISEGNKWSLQAVGFRWLKRLLGRQRAEVRDMEAGIEFWEDTTTGKLVTRQADMNWLERVFADHGVRLAERRAGQFTEIFIWLPWKPLRWLVHAFNAAWFRWVRFPGPAFGNLLVFRKDR